MPAASATVLAKYFFDIAEVLNPTIKIPLSYFNAYSLPTTIIFDKEGKEKFRITSGIDFTSKNFINKIIDIEKL